MGILDLGLAGGEMPVPEKGKLFLGRPRTGAHPVHPPKSDSLHFFFVRSPQLIPRHPRSLEVAALELVRSSLKLEVLLQSSGVGFRGGLGRPVRRLQDLINRRSQSKGGQIFSLSGGTPKGSSAKQVGRRLAVPFDLTRG